MQAVLWIAAAASAGIVGLAAHADRRRSRRVRLDAVGWMPWPLVLLAALLIGATCAALAIRG